MPPPQSFWFVIDPSKFLKIILHALDAMVNMFEINSNLIAK